MQNKHPFFGCRFLVRFLTLVCCRYEFPRFLPVASFNLGKLEQQLPHIHIKNAIRGLFIEIGSLHLYNFCFLPHPINPQIFG